MTKTTRVLAPLLIALGAAACGARSNRPTLPTQACDEVLSRYVQGESLDRIAGEFRLGDRAEARHVVHDAMISMMKRYYRDR